MDQSTASELNEINLRFYTNLSEQFDHSRNYYWEGWDMLLLALADHGFDSQKGFSILDIGCGNGRFASFLTDKGLNFQYEGWDFSKVLLNSAEKRLAEKLPKDRYKFERVDLLTNEFSEVIKFQKLEKSYVLIVNFGVIHHLAGHNKRLEIIRESNRLLKQNGFYVFTVWDFMKVERFAKKVKDWNLVGIDTNAVEEGDKLLDWKKDGLGYRYVHHFSDKEIDIMISESGLELIHEFTADGKEGNLNRYFICKHKL